VGWRFCQILFFFVMIFLDLRLPDFRPKLQHTSQFPRFLMSTPLNDFANGGAAAAPTQTHHQQSTANQPPELQSLLLPSLECSLCLSLICEPISTGCGHSFCRVCLVKSLRRHKKRCPSCREVCHIMAENAAENVMIKSMAMLLDQETYLARLEEAKQEKASWTTLYPIFYYNSTIFPQNILSLHLFEPRYKLMMQRVVNTTNAFAYVPNFNNYHAQLGDIALVAKVKEVEFLAGKYLQIDQSQLFVAQLFLIYLSYSLSLSLSLSS
jgi:hypothetical protein